MSQFLDDYIEFVSEFTETKHLIHVWAIITSISALIGRSRHMTFGASNIYPNIYAMVVGDPGTRKSTAIKLAKRLCETAGYGEFAFESGSKESYFNSLARKNEVDPLDIELDVKKTYNGVELWEPPMGESHSFICSDEFDQFIGIHNMTFLSALGDLWDRDSDYRYETIKHGIKVIRKPYITILGGTTPSTFSAIFPAQSIDHGFLSRLIMIPCKGLEKKLALPPEPNKKKEKDIIDKLFDILSEPPREIKRTKEADKIFEYIYKKWTSPFDARFAGYASRRHMHLLKLSLVYSALNSKEVIDEDVLIEANTLLTYTELLMPDVIGEMGKGPHTTSMNLVINTLSSKPNGLSLTALYKLLYREVRSIEELDGVLNLLRIAQRIVTDENGLHHFVPSLIEIPKDLEQFIDRSKIKYIT